MPASSTAPAGVAVPAVPVAPTLELDRERRCLGTNVALTFVASAVDSRRDQPPDVVATGRAHPPIARPRPTPSTAAATTRSAPTSALRLASRRRPRASAASFVRNADVTVESIAATDIPAPSVECACDGDGGADANEGGGAIDCGITGGTPTDKGILGAELGGIAPPGGIAALGGIATERYALAGTGARLSIGGAIGAGGGVYPARVFDNIGPALAAPPRATPPTDAERSASDTDTASTACTT